MCKWKSQGAYKRVVGIIDRIGEIAMKEFDEIDILELVTKIMGLERKNLKSKKLTDTKMVEEIQKIIVEFTNQKF